MAGIKPRMSEREAEAFRDFAQASTSYFEFGIGGSTYWAGQLVKGRVVAIDSDHEWVEKAKTSLEQSPYDRSLFHINIGATKEWGYPVETKHPEIFKPYYQSITKYSPKEFDFCLVDGRFRVASFLTTIKYARSDAIVAIHDYRSRQNYHLAEEFGRIIMEVEDISFFIRRRDVNLLALEAVLEAHAAVAA